MYTLKVAGLGVFAALEACGAWLFFRAATNAALPNDIRWAAFALGVCIVLGTVAIIFASISDRKEGTNRSL